MTRGRTGYFNGLAAEDIAARLYLVEGYRLLERRWKCAEGEVDLILGRAGAIVFVEVKARRVRDAAATAITPAQWRRLGEAASRYLAERAPDAACRFDVVLIDRAGRPERIENARSFDG